MTRPTPTPGLRRPRRVRAARRRAAIPFALLGLALAGLGCAASVATDPGGVTEPAVDSGAAIATAADVRLPVDPAVTKGRLDNGLVYLVRENRRPEARAELRLVVKAGSVDEDEDQRGLAHFLEHMPFNGTESFAGNEIVAYFESIGARFGADLNAYTSFDETVYMLTIPTDREELLPSGVDILAEFAGKALLDPAEIEKERGVVLDEWRRGLGAGKRVRDVQLPILLHGSRYAERLPIGLPEVVGSADRERLLRFYRDWYHPSRMALIAVGDFEADAVVARIREAFGSMPAEPGPRERPDWPVPAHDDTLYALADDPELRGTSVGLTIKRPPSEDDATRVGYRRGLVQSMALGMVNDRLSEVARGEDPPFLGAGVRSHPIGRTVELTSVSARVKEGGEARGLEALVVEMRRAAEHGFLAGEVERTRREMLAGIEASWAERDKTPSGGLASEYTRHFLHDEPIPGIDVEREIFRAELPGIDADECHRELLALLDGHGVVVEATRPTREGLADEADLRRALRAAAAADVAPWVDEGAGGALLASPRPPGRVVERREIESVGATEILLSNGVRVFVKPTDFQDDEVIFRGTAFGGTSLAADGDLISASMAGHLLGESGWGGRSPIELGKLLAGKMVSVRPFHGDRTHGVSGSSTVADLSTALELAVLVMTEPNRDEAAAERLRERLRSRLANRDADPSTKYGDRVTALFTADHPRARPFTLERLDELDPEKAVRFHETAFANAADFTFFFAGNLDVDALVPELERTLGSLPATGEASAAWVDRGVRYPGEAADEIVRAGSEPRAHTTLAFPSYAGDDPREWHRLRTAASILGRRLRETLREDLGGTYGVSVQYARRILGPDTGRIEIRFGADPSEIDALAAEAIRVVEELRATGPTADEIAKEKEIQTRELETQRESNGFWLGSLASLWERGRPFDEMAGRQARIDALDAEELGRVFRESFRPEPTTRITWLPEGDAGGD